MQLPDKEHLNLELLQVAHCYMSKLSDGFKFVSFISSRNHVQWQRKTLAINGESGVVMDTWKEEKVRTHEFIDFFNLMKRYMRPTCSWWMLNHIINYQCFHNVIVFNIIMNVSIKLWPFVASLIVHFV